ncbi:MAG: VPLPA-CTERM sorting domain-containing protein [Gammaproteobacteria bacterium]|nr:VPLPA-CTERM sorting domain-containing protein [Gammaproteobacteria bacterium]
MQHRSIKPLAILAATALCWSSHATAITQLGTDVSFTYDENTLFGTGMVVGNSILFLPTDFKATSNNTDGAVTTSETLNITVDVTSGGGYEITNFQLAEFGDYTLSGTSSSVTASGRLQVSSNTSTCGIFPCVDSEIFNVGGLSTVGATTEWTGGVGIDLVDTAGWGSDSSVVAQIQNNLSATSTVFGESAMIQKKGEGVGLIVNPIPVPAAVWLFGSALGVLGWMRRKTRH